MRRATWIALLLGLFLAPAPATAALYVFHQTGPSSHPDDVSFAASISVAGSLADLPTIQNDPPPTPPLDFGNLLALLFSVGEVVGGIDYDTTLANFTLREGGDSVPLWFISPSGLLFTEIDYQFSIDGFGAGSVMEFRSDGGGPCFLEACTVTGNWVAVPEPHAVWLLAAGLLMLGAWGLRSGSPGRDQPNFAR